VNSDRTPAWFVILCFAGPLVLLPWTRYADMGPLHRQIVREGTIFNVAAFVMLFACRVLSGAPLIGALFTLLLVCTWMLTVIGSVALMVMKHRDPSCEIPFISPYAAQLEAR